MKTKLTDKLMTGFYLLFSLILLNATISTASAKGIFKCVKANGEIEYTQSASKNCESQQIKKRGGQSDQEAINKLHEDREKSKIAEDKERDAALAKQDEARAQKEMAEYCTNLKNNLKQITIANRVFETNTKGKRVKLSEEQRQQRIKDNQKNLNTHCN